MTRSSPSTKRLRSRVSSPSSMRFRRPLTAWLGTVISCVVLAGVCAPPSYAKLSKDEFKDVESRYVELFQGPGDPEGKKDVMRVLGQDGESRSLKLMAEAVLKECAIMWDLRVSMQQLTLEHADVMTRCFKGVSPELGKEINEIQAKIDELEKTITAESGAMDFVIKAVADGPEALRKNIFRRAKNSKQWTYRAAAARIAASKMNSEADSRQFVLRVLVGDKDRRVRTAALEVAGRTKEGWEDLVIGRLGDDDWGVQLMAVRILRERDYKPAVPHLIQCLGRTTPRVAEEIAGALHHFTGEKIAAFSDAWMRWWEDHKDDWEDKVEIKKQDRNKFKKIHFYGMEIKSDRVIFIIDVSHSMRLETKNHNPRDKWKPPPITTGKEDDAPPPPPPPEILSGPKINVAKHELKKAIQALASDSKFTIIAFKNVAKAWRPTLVEASKKNKAAALKWVRNMKPSGSTYIDGALRLAFQIGGIMNVDEKYTKDMVDTIVLMSDGAPTDNTIPASKLMDPDIILKHVEEWNAGKRVVINCIGVDMLPFIKFLKDLAAANGGVYIDR